MRGALQDLDLADSMHPNSAPDTHRLRYIFESGNTQQVAISYSAVPENASDGLRLAGEALAAGDGEAAFVEYEKLESRGYNWAPAQFGKAISCILELDLDGALSYLSRLELRSSSPMAVNICAVLCIVDALQGRFDTEKHEDLQESLADFPNYNFSSSSLSWLFEGLEKKGLLRDYPQLVDIKQALLENA